jgi:alpha-tubulin suppressor-like RCC1 family protein
MKKNFRGLRFLLILVLFATSPLMRTAWAATPKIAAGGYHTIIVKSGGTLWAWGRNQNGQLGDGTNIDKKAPVHIGSDNTWVSVSAGSLYMLAVKVDGTLWAWGWNYDGQLGMARTLTRIPLNR